MNKKYALHFRLFNRHPFDEPTDAIRLVELVADFAPELSPSHFGGNEPIRAPFRLQGVPRQPSSSGARDSTCC
jgi:hypothetical protein